MRSLEVRNLPGVIGMVVPITLASLWLIAGTAEQAHSEEKTATEWTAVAQALGHLGIARTVCNASGFQNIAHDDHENMTLQFPVYDALYAYCRAKTGGRSSNGRRWIGWSG